MDNVMKADFSLFEENLTPPAFACFRELFENVKKTIMAGGKRESYEVPLTHLMEAGDIADVDTVAKTIREIIACMVKFRKEDYLMFIPFFASVCIENGLIRYSIPRELEQVMPTATVAVER
jgi:hypothetical protein